MGSNSDDSGEGHLPAGQAAAPTGAAAAPERPSSRWVPRLIDAAESVPDDAADGLLLDAVEDFQRQQGELDLRRAALLARLAARNRSSEAADHLIGEVAMIRCVTFAAAGRLWTTSVALAGGLRATATALAAGAIPWSHVEVIADGASAVPSARVGVFERAALQQVEGVSLGRARDRVRRLAESANPQGMVERHRAASSERHVAIEPAADGMAWLTLYLDAVEAVAIHDRLSRAAVAAHGQQGETRHLGELRADVAADLLTSDLPWMSDEYTAQLFGRRTRPAVRIVPEVHVTVPALTLLERGDEPARLQGYGPIDPETARRLAGAAPGWFRILTHPETGVALSVGRKHYKVPKPLRRWLQVRDEVCRYPGCAIPASRCDIDHIVPWHGGGSTEATNLAHLCRHHHQQKDRGWAVQWGPGQTLQWTSPYGRTRTTTSAATIQQYDTAA